MISIIRNPKIRYNYILQTPEELSDEEHQVVITFHGSNGGSAEELEKDIHREFELGRWKFSENIRNKTIFVAPLIFRGDEYLSNGMDVDPQRMSRATLLELCKKEYPNLYAPHLEIKKIIDDAFATLKDKYKLKPKVILIGLSAGGQFAINFGIMYPEIIESILSFLNVNMFIPEKSYEGASLPFPFGLDGLNECPAVEVDQSKIEQYLKIPKLVLTDSNEPGKSDSLPWDVDQKFYDEYIKVFGKPLHERAINISNLLNSKYQDNIELVVTSGNGHNILDEDFDRYIEKYASKAL